MSKIYKDEKRKNGINFKSDFESVVELIKMHNNYCDAYAPCTQKGRIHDKSKKKHALYRLSAGSFHAGSCFLSAGFGGQRIIEHIHDPGHEHDRHNPRGRDFHSMLSVDTLLQLPVKRDAAWSKAGCDAFTQKGTRARRSRKCRKTGPRRRLLRQTAIP